MADRMILFSVEEFTARRRDTQTALEQDLHAAVIAALDTQTDTSGWNDLLDVVTRLYRTTYYLETGARTPGMPRGFRSELLETLRLTQGHGDATVSRIEVWLATAILSQVSIQASLDDPEELFLEWVTMEDADVRATHKAADHQVQPIGDKYDVGGEKMRYPGDPTVSIALWINCRCALRPVLASEANTARGTTTTMSTPTVTWTNTPTVTWTPTAPAAPADDAADAPVPISVPWHGILAPEGVASGDGRMFAPNSLTNRDLPLPLTWQKASSDGHGGSVVVAKIEKIERVDNLMRASGHFIANPEADEVIGLLGEFGKFGVSVDADDATMEIDEANEMVVFTAARIASASIVAIPAFAEAYVALGPWDDADVTDPVDAPVEAPAAEDVAAAKKPFPKKKDDPNDPNEDPDDPNEDTEPQSEEDAEDDDPKKKKKKPMPPAYSNFGRGPGWVTNPEDTKRLHDYWTVPGQPGYAKIGWGTEGDFNRCRAELGEEIGENSPDKLIYLNAICAQWQHDAIGVWPGRGEKLAVNVLTRELTDTPAGEALNLVASVGHQAPAAWFTNPHLSGLTAMTVSDEGRVFGHLAGWDTCHIGFKDTCTAPPQSATNYAYFLTGQVALDDGTMASVGPITIGGGHAGPRLNLRAAVEHYDSTSSVVADVTMGEDDYGIWYAGWVRPGVTDEAVTALRASALSGDWRKVGANLELVAALAVNTPGFPVPRTRVAASSQGQLSLVASGIVNTTTTTADLNQIEVETIAEAVVAAMAAREARKVRMQSLAARMSGDV